MNFIEAQMIGPRRKVIDDRERLAEIAHRKRCAKHKGRNHWRNWERRRMALEKKRAAEIAVAKQMAADRRFMEAARSYWRGEREAHP